MPGRRPKSAYLKVMLGTPQRDRVNYAEPMPATNIEDDGPDWFTAQQKAEWKFVKAAAPAGLLKQLDRSMLESWVIIDDICRRAAIGLAQTPNLRTKKAETCLTVLRHFTPLKRSLATELGFSPAARPRIQVAPEPNQGAGEFEKLMG